MGRTVGSAMGQFFEVALNLWKTCGKTTDLCTEYLYLISFSTIVPGFVQVFHTVFHRKV